MSKKISDLPQLTVPVSTDKLLIEDVPAGATKYILLSDLLNTGLITVAGLPTAIPSNKFNIPYKFSVWRSAALSLGASGSTKIPFDTKEFDTGSNVDIATNVGRFTAPVAGFYSFTTQVAVLAGTSFIINAAFYKNGVQYKALDQKNTNSGNSSSGGAINAVQLSAGDYIEVYAFNSLGSAVTANVGQAGIWFTGKLESIT